MTTENTPESTTESTPDVEVKNPAAVLAKNRALLTELAEVKAALLTSQDALGAAQSDKTAMGERWYQLAVLEPLEADLRSASAAPWKYLRDTSAELGLLKMQPDSEGFERPAWFNEKGEPADLSGGLHRFLSGVYARTQNDLGKCLRASGITGGGATTSSGSYRPTPSPAAPPPAPITALGLR